MKQIAPTREKKKTQVMKRQKKMEERKKLKILDK